MRKVTLVFVQDNEIPTAGQTTPLQIEVDLPEGRHRIEAVSVQNSALQEGEYFDSIATVLTSRDVSNLVGQLLTYVDATYSNEEQRKAHKGIINQTVHRWLLGLDERAKETLEYGLGRLLEESINKNV